MRPPRREPDVLAFQRQWNATHPEDLIAEDGIYGPHTETRYTTLHSKPFPRRQWQDLDDTEKRFSLLELHPTDPKETA